MFLVVGESLVDLIAAGDAWRFEATPGGSPLNVAVGLAAAGHPVRLATEIGDDLFGALVRDQLARYGVRARDVRHGPAGTSLAFARLGAGGAADYHFRFRWDWSAAPDLAGVTCLHTGSLAAVVDPGAQAVETVVATARRRGVTVCFDPNVRPALVGPRRDAVARVERLVAAADIVRASAEDLAWLYPGTPELAAARRWARLGPGLVVVTRGAAGAVALHGGRVRECTAPEVAVVDTVGAGDMFTAGLLSSLAAQGALAAPAGDTVAGGTVAGGTVAAALRQAAATAAAACARRGATPPPADEVRALVARTAVRTGLGQQLG